MGSEEKTLQAGITYGEYRELANKSLETGDIRGGAGMRDYVELNNRRMDRAEKTVKIGEDLAEAVENMTESHTMIVLSEAWCGDASQSVPVLAKIGELSDKLKTRILFRDDNLDLMDRYLTNGGRAIPKAIFVRDSDGAEVASWGPRPEEPQAIVKAWKEAGGENKDKMIADVQKWYAKDRGNSIQKEIKEVVKGL
ncbi:thioredoxin [Fulvitalea axinellae]|uniref:Thioredoxin n=1 Tax=Fulvitalea axinellae TaxID=1182444 RepID=A0AAU9D8B6_9BACT|nr:thioredoxin [Fulvitalea axinellae]